MSKDQTPEKIVGYWGIDDALIVPILDGEDSINKRTFCSRLAANLDWLQDHGILSPQELEAEFLDQGIDISLKGKASNILKTMPIEVLLDRLWSDLGDYKFGADEVSDEGMPDMDAVSLSAHLLYRLRDTGWY